MTNEEAVQKTREEIALLTTIPFLSSGAIIGTAAVGSHARSAIRLYENTALWLPFQLWKTEKVETL